VTGGEVDIVAWAEPQKYTCTRIAVARDSDTIGIIWILFPGEGMAG